MVSHRAYFAELVAEYQVLSNLDSRTQDGVKGSVRLLRRFRQDIKVQLPVQEILQVNTYTSAAYLKSALLDNERCHGPLAFVHPCLNNKSGRWSSRRGLQAHQLCLKE